MVIVALSCYAHAINSKLQLKISCSMHERGGTRRTMYTLEDEILLLKKITFIFQNCKGVLKI